MSSERSSGDFGARLRDARERRGISLRQIADATKISVGVLEALERNDISKLPGGIFGRAFVRCYAVEVGLDPEKTIEQFITQFPNDSVIAGHPTSAPFEDSVAIESERQTAGTFLWLAVISVPVLAGLLYFATAGRHAASEPLRSAVASSDANEPAATAAPARVPEPAAELSPDKGTAVASSGTLPTTVPPAAIATPAGDQLTITLSAKRPCWISATVDGQRSIERLLQTGERQTVTVRREMVLTVGDASAVAVQFNGADGRALGTAGEVVTARFNLMNYKDFLRVR